MKKIVILFIICILFCSCSSNNDNLSDAFVKNSNDTSYETADIDVLFGTHRIVTENQAIFSDLIKNNPVDKAYHSAKSDATTQSMISIENEFLDIWMEELEFSIENFTSHLTEEDKVMFKTIQNDWEKYIFNNQLFSEKIFNNDEYKSYVGKMFLVEEVCEQRNEVRKRALYIKYLQFTMNPSEEVEFKYKKT